MRPVDPKFPVSQHFGDGATEGVAPSSDPNSGTGYLVYLYGNYQPFGHAGEDIACPIGTPVVAMAAGTVLWADWGTNLPGDDSDAGYRQRWYLYKSFPGIVSVIQHDGWIGIYAHLSSNDAAPAGTAVTEGQIIGYSGNTGGVPPHLHVGALVDLTYSTGNGLIYGCTDPEPHFGTTIQAASSGTTTPIQEDDMGTVDAFTDTAMQNLRKTVDDAIANSPRINDIEKSVAWQEQFAATYLPQILAKAAGADPAAIAAAIPPGIAKDVADELAKRLQTPAAGS